MSTTRHTHRVARLLPLLAAALLATGALPTHAQGTQTGQAAVGLPVTQAANIVSGQTSVTFKLPVAAFGSLRLQLTVPVPGVTLTVQDPQGNTVFAPNDPGVGFLDGSALTPPLPGGQFLTPDIPNPANGEWTVRADFPASPHATVALLTPFVQSALQVGLVLSAPVYRVGNPVPLGLLAVNNGQPLLGLAPRITVSKAGTAPVVLNARDSGQPADYDGRAGDGIYSQGVVLNDPGTYLVQGDVDVPLPGGGTGPRSAQAVLEIVPANYVLGGVNGVINRGPSNCVASLDVTTTGTAGLAGTYATAATLRSPSGKTLIQRSSATLGSAGSVDTSMRFLAADIRNTFGEGGVFKVDPLDVLSFIAGQPWLELRKAAAYSFPDIPLAQLCSAPIEITTGATVGSPLRGRFIGQLDFTLPIRVTDAGSYQVSFKVIDSQGVEVGQFAVSPFMSAGTNNVGATVLADRLQNSDGPFTIDSVLVVGNGRSAQASRVTVSGSGFSRWQFFPTITGDLNGDGAVGTADRDIVTQARGQTPRVPGDRRDINGDGKIDLLDAREIVNRQCAAGSCPTN